MNFIDFLIETGLDVYSGYSDTTKKHFVGIGINQDFWVYDQEYDEWHGISKHNTTSGLALKECANEISEKRYRISNKEAIAPKFI